MANNEVKYPAAFDQNGLFTEITSVTKEDRESHQYRCIRCGEPMTPVLGDIRLHFFRHLGKKCSYDHYLHQYAEEVFFSEYNHCLETGAPFYLWMLSPVKCNQACVLTIHRGCNERSAWKFVDLTRHFKKISREIRVPRPDEKYRIPDILLQTIDGSTELWIEFCVSSPVKEDKKEEGKIIEIKINDEDDVKALKKHIIKESNDNKKWVRLYNLERKEFYGTPSETPPCGKYFEYLSPYVNGPGQHHIISELPTIRERELVDRVVLKLNWLGKYNTFGEAPESLSEEELARLCEEYRKNQSEDSPIKSLVVTEAFPQRVWIKNHANLYQSHTNTDKHAFKYPKRAPSKSNITG